MRFQCTEAAFNADITFQNLLDTVLFATTAITAADVYQQVRVNSVEVWAPTQGVSPGAESGFLTPSTVIVIFDGVTVGAAGDQKTHTDTSMSIQPAHVKARPDPLTQGGQFQASSSNVAFRLDIPEGTIVDVSMTFRQPVMGVAVVSQIAPVGLTIGATYFRGLDGKPVSTTNLPVVGAIAVA
jgi:hypothetical protein